MKKQIILFLGLTAIAVFTVAISNAQISSTKNGGGWSSTSTWIGGIVPGASDNVIIDGNVYVTTGAACLNITINSGNTLRNFNTLQITLDIYGNFTNNGVIKNNTSGHLTLEIRGDISNNGIWEVQATNLNGAGEQLIALQSGKTFNSFFSNNNSTDTIKAISDLAFNEPFSLNNNVLNLDNHNIRFTGTNSGFMAGTIVSPNEFLGTVNMYLTNYIEGDLIITDTLQNRNSYNAHVYLNGSITNNGVIKNNISSSLTLYISEDITNNGIWENNSNYLNGTSQQNITLQVGKTFGSDFTNTNSTDTIVAITDLWFTGYFNLNNNILNLDNHNIRFTGANTYFGRGTIVSPSEFRSTVNMYGTTYIEGDLIITDTLQNTNSNATVYLNGNLTNNGIIKTNISHSMSLNISEDISNNGIWENNYTRLNGTSQQNITLQSGKTFDSDFINLNSTDTIVALTDLHFTKDFALNNNILNLDNHNIRFTGANTYFGMGTIVSPSEFQGTVNMYSTTYIEGDLIITDTLQNTNSNATVYLNGSLTNNGIIKTNISHSMSLYISEDITNNGIWENNYTRLNGTSQQNITLQAGKTFDSDFRNANSIDTIVALTDLHFTKDFDLDNNILNLDNHNIRFTGADTYIGPGTIVSPNEFQGTVSISSVTYIKGDLIITDTLQNRNSNNVTVYLNGNLTNNGIVKNNSSSMLALHITGDLDSYGPVKGNSSYPCYLYVGGDLNAYESWEYANTRMDGTTGQNIYLEPGKTFGSDFQINNPTDTIHVLTDLLLDGNFHLGDDVLNLNSHVVEFIGTGHSFGRGTILSPTEFKGEVNMVSITYIEGDLIITDTLQNKTGGNYSLYVNGSITNNGVIQDNTTFGLALYISKDITNNGIWENYQTLLNGSGQQLIYLQTAKTFGGRFNIDNDIDTVKATSNLIFTGSLGLGLDILNLDHHNLRFIGQDTHFGHGTVVSPNEFQGTVNMSNTTYIIGDLIITDTLHNKNSHSATVYVSGNITNNGIIQNNTSLNLTLYLAGGITNNGIWENLTTYLNGTGQQLISLQSGKTFNSSFINSNSTDTIKSTTDLVFTKTFNLGSNVLNLDNHNIRFIGTDTYIGYGTIVSPDEFLGTVNMHNTTYIEGDLIITDTLQNRNAQNATLYVNGAILNNGIIRNYTSSNLTLYLAGNVSNNGIWDNYMSMLNGTTDQTISLMNNKSISGDVTFRANYGASPYQWYYNDAVLDSPDFIGETSSNLVWLVPVSNSGYGIYYCQTNAGNSRNIMVNYGLMTLQFDGVDDYIEAEGIPFPSGDLTIEAWIYPTALTGFHEIVFFYNDTSGVQFRAETDGRLLYGESFNSTFNYVRSPVGSFSANSWTHVAVTKQDDHCNLYINGIHAGYYQFDNNPEPDTLSIGARSKYMDRFFVGSIDEVRIWNDALDISLIRENMYRPLQRTETGLKNYWQFNEEADSVAYDLVGGNNGTLYNMTDANRITSTAPIPYNTIGDGNWEATNTWATGQNAPVHPWSRAIIKHNITLNSNMELIEMIVDTNAVMTISTGDTLTVGGE